MRHAVLWMVLVVALILSSAFPEGQGPDHGQCPDSAGQILTMIAAEQGGSVDFGEAIALSAGVLEEIGVPAFESLTGASGAGQVIAVLDTGIDPLIPGFLDPQGINRILGWQDLTGEGLARVLGRFAASDGLVEVGSVKLNVSGLKSRSSTYLVGVLPDAIQRAVGSPAPVYFAVVDPDVMGVFDSVAVDTDRDGILGDESVLRRYDESRKAVAVPISADACVSVVVARIGENGESVVFGADLNGHGTALAGIAAGSGPGSFRGVSPKSAILAIKVAKADGRGDWSSVESGIRYALEKGADTILVGSVPDRIPDEQSWARLQQTAAAQGSNLVFPAGNKGPGVGTVAFASSSACTVVAGGSLPKAVEDTRLTGVVGVLGWYPFSSCGPDPQGNRGVDLLAPAVTVAPKSGYHSRARFEVIQGTSVSAAYTAGAVSLLREVGEIHQRTDHDQRAVGSLLEGAEPVPGLLPIEQGLGRLNVTGAWNQFKQGMPDSRLQITRKWAGVVATDGVWSRGTDIGAMPLWLDNLGPVARAVTLTTSASWLRAEAEQVYMPSISERFIWVYGSEELPPGFYSAEILADDPSTSGVDARLNVSVTVPHRPSSVGTAPESTAIRFELANSARDPVSREFFEVPQVTESMSVSLVGGSGVFYGLYSPEGILVDLGRLVGDSATRVGLPAPGLWQITLFRDPRPSAKGILPDHLEVAFTLPFAVDLGATADYGHYVTLASAAKTIVLSFAGPDAAHEWRYRHSLALPRDSATTITYPVVTEDTEAISLRIGTVKGSEVKAYLYHFSEKDERWIEVAATSTESSSRASLYYRSPKPGRYVAYMEGYGPLPTVYGEIDTLLINKAPETPASEIKPGEAVFVKGVVQEHHYIRSRSDAGSSRYVVIKPSAGTGVLGVFERPAVGSQSIPVVQVSGSGVPGPQLMTIRAWAYGGRYPLDTLVVIGGTSYQLDNGKVTAWVTRRGPVSCETQDGNETIILPEAWTKR